MLSVITITYNDVVGLRRTLASVAEQSIACEHIVIDGASQDGTLEVLERHKAHLFSWKSEQDGGRYQAMNKGISLATGDAIWLMHSGDRFASSTSAEIGYNALLNASSRWGYGLSRVIRDGEVIELRGAIPFRRAKFLVGRDTIPHQAVVMQKGLIDELQGYDETFGLAADQEFLLRALLVDSPLVIPHILCDFDGSGAGSTRSAWAHYKDMISARRSNAIVLGQSRSIDLTATVIYWARTVVASKYKRPL